MDALHLSEINNLDHAMARTPSGVEVLGLAKRLGLITPYEHGARRAFKADFTQISTTALSNEQGYWTAEYGRIIEMLGLLTGQEKDISRRLKSATTRERARLRREAETAVPPVKKLAGQVNDEASESAGVTSIEEEGQMLDLLIPSVAASKEAIAGYLTAISREISYRAAQMNAGIYG
jgi:hypothetical protein